MVVLAVRETTKMGSRTLDSSGEFSAEEMVVASSVVFSAEEERRVVAASSEVAVREVVCSGSE